MILEEKRNGHRLLRLENDRLSVGVLPEKGADICELVYRPSRVQFLMQTPSGLQPPGERPPAEFVENYEGGWQELFPNCNEACQVNGAEIPFHGEAALLPWQAQVLEAPPGEARLALSVRCQRLPFTLERRMHLHADGRLETGERITNAGQTAQPFVWGQHLVLGGDFLADGCRLELPAHRLATPEQTFEPATARLAPGQQTAWPVARGFSEGEFYDLREIPGPQAHTHDDAFAYELDEGWLAVTNPALGLRFRLEWDAAVFPWVVLWMPYGGSDAPPLTGIYGLGVEPWVARYPLAEAIRLGQARWLEPGQSLTTAWTVAVDEI
ncbi:MAG TPA: DUF4432 family protein [Anaerolineales bacterium]